jgi:hypothetical protein
LGASSNTHGGVQRAERAEGRCGAKKGVQEQQSAPEQEKTVVVNEGMSKKEEEKLNERLADLEDKVERENTQQEAAEPEPATENAEDQSLEAAQDYYAAAAAGNYTYTYDALTSTSQSRFTEEEWVAANTALGSDAASYDIYSTELVDDTTATVGLTVTDEDGSSDDPHHPVCLRERRLETRANRARVRPLRRRHRHGLRYCLRLRYCVRPS